jgi:hypothetical protein
VHPCRRQAPHTGAERLRRKAIPGHTAQTDSVPQKPQRREAHIPVLRILLIAVLLVVVVGGAGLALWVSTVQPSVHTVEKTLDKELLVR